MGLRVIDERRVCYEALELLALARCSLVCKKEIVSWRAPLGCSVCEHGIPDRRLQAVPLPERADTHGRCRPQSHGI